MKDFRQERFVAAPSAAHLAGEWPSQKSISAAWLPPLPSDVDGPLDGVLNRPRPSRHRWYLARGKRALDVAFVLLTAPISLSIILLAALALWLEGGKPFYRQDRLGKNGKVFSMWKLRTMVPGAEDQLSDYLERDPALKHEWETTQKLRRDPRVTRLGSMLRATSIDELPQLWNVLLGHMSLVGPRPMMPDQLAIYGNPAAYFAVRPGITGIWQVAGRNRNVFAYRETADAEYFASVSLFGDLVLLFRTAGAVLRRTGC